MIKNNNLFTETKIFKNLSCYEDMRVNFEVLLIFELVKHFKCREILEIGFYEGKTFGALLEANCTESLTAIDLKFEMALYDKFYKDNSKKVTFLNMSSTEFKTDTKFDFINVDGNHELPVVQSDLVNAFNMIKKTGIILVDDYKYKPVDFAIDQILKQNYDFVPFLADEQGIYFHHVSHDTTEFLDTKIKNIFESFCYIDNVMYKNFQITKISCLPAITKNDDVFSMICKKYKL